MTEPLQSRWNRLHLTTVLPLLVLVAALVWLEFKSHRPQQPEQRAQILLGQLLQTDHQVDKQLLQLRLGRILNYDPLTAKLADMEGIIAELRELPLPAPNTLQQRYAGTLEQLLTAYQQKAMLAEDFKTDNALLRNSVTYLPGAVTQLETKLGDSPQDQQLRMALLRYSQALLSSHSPASSESMQRVEALATRVRQRASGVAANDDLDRLLRHTDLIVNYTRSVNQLLDQGLSSPLQSAIAEAQSALQALLYEQIRINKHYNLLLMLLAGLLLAYLVTLFRRLNRRTGELASSNLQLAEQIHERERAQQVLAAQNQVMATMVKKQALPDVLRELCLNIEALTPGAMASVLLVDEQGLNLGKAVAPSLPADYVAAFNSLPVGPDQGSCGSAAFSGQAVIASDISSDPRWRQFKDFAETHDIRSCWSTPFYSADGHLLGTFALSYHQPMAPTEEQVQLLGTAADMATLAVDNSLAEQALANSQQRYRHIFETVPVSLWEQDYSRVKRRLDQLRAEGVTDIAHWINQHPDNIEQLRDQIGIQQVNAATLKMFHAPDVQALHDNRLKLLAEGSMKSVRDRLVVLSEGGRSYQGESCYLTLGGDQIEVLINIAFPEDGGDFSRVLVSVIDITPLKQAEAELQEARDKAETTLRSIADGVFTTDPDGCITSLNPSAARLVGWADTEAIGLPLTDVLNLVDQWSHQPVLAPIEQALLEQRSVALGDHIVLMDHAGHESAVEISAAPLRGKRHQQQGSVVVVRDVTRTRQLARDLIHQASHDPLTGLINRRAFETRLEAALASAHSDQRCHALCFLDLDQFKIVNDTCGHVAGDELLKRLAHRLKSKIRGRDTLGRLGGDEFAVLLEDCPLERAEEIAEDLLASVREFRFSWEERKFELGVSIGLTAITSRAESTARLLSEADVACYAAKDLGRNRVHLHLAEDQETSQRHRELQWAADITNALEQNRFRIFCQRLQPLQGDGPGSPGPHYEVLLRLRDVEDHEVMPGAFIPAAERYNLMQSIDRWAIEHTFAWYAGHRAIAEQVGLNLAINLSGNSLSREGLVPFILRQQQQHKIPAKRICFEVTETAAIGNLAQAADFIRQLKGHGFLFALDDFGTGLSSFAYLKNLPVDFLKIDGAFVRDLLTDPADEAMVRAINQIGHTMGKKTIAEWAETDAIVNRLRDLGVDYAQGYAIARPCPIDELLEHFQRDG